MYFDAQAGPDSVLKRVCLLGDSNTDEGFKVGSIFILAVQLPFLLPAYLEKLDDCEMLILNSGGAILTALVLSYTCLSKMPTVTTIPCNNRNSKLNISRDPTLFHHLPRALVHSQPCRNSVDLSAVLDDQAMSTTSVVAI